MSGYRDDRAALADKVEELTRELAAAKERLRKESEVLAEIAANVEIVRASVRHETAPAAPTKLEEQPSTPTPTPTPGPTPPTAWSPVRLAVILLVTVTALTFVLFALPRRDGGEVASLSKSDASSTGGPPEVFGEIRGVAADSAGRIVGITPTILFAANAQTLEILWTAPLGSDERGSGKLIPVFRGDQLVALSDDGIFFHDEKGNLKTKYLFRTTSTPQLCVAPPSEVVLRAYDGVLHFDAATGARLPGAASCDKPRNECNPLQGCPAPRPSILPAMTCKPGVRAATTTYAICDEDGTRRSFLVALDDKGTERWRLEHETWANDMFVLDDTLIVDTFASLNKSKLTGISITKGKVLFTREISEKSIFARTPLLVASQGTLLTLDPADGHELRRLHSQAH